MFIADQVTGPLKEETLDKKVVMTDPDGETDPTVVTLTDSWEDEQGQAVDIEIP